jgi:flagellar biosynthesis anti-sigma factor FlgM
MMRIDPYRQAADTDATTRLDRTAQTEQADKAAKVRTADTKQKDSVEPSDEARLAGDAIEAAKSAPDVRPEAVERARRLMESGNLGKDAHKLADSLIDDMLKK